MQTYNKPNLDNLNQYMQDSNSGGQKIKWWSLPTGTSIIRILPPWDAKGLVALPVYSHRIEYQPAGSQYKKYSWVCTNSTFGTPCNICEGLKSLSSQGINTEPYESGNRTFYINALVIQDPNYGRDPQNSMAPNTHVLMRIPKTVYDWVVQMITNPAFGDITDVNTGVNLIISRTGKGLETKYQITSDPNGRTAIDTRVLENLELYDISKIFSTGFSDEDIQGLVNYLRVAGTQFAQQMPNMPNQMYPPQQMPNMQPPVQAYQTPMGLYDPSRAPQSSQSYPAAPYNPQPVMPPVQSNQIPAQQYGQIPTQQYNQQVPTTPIPNVQQTNAPTASDKPKCFGNFNEDGVTCVICGEELECRRCTQSR